MVNAIRIAIFVASLGLGVYQYNRNIIPGPDPAPAPVVTPDRVELIIDTEVESFPPMPSTSLSVALQPLDGIVTDPDDALRFARAFKHWATLLKNDTYITNLSQYQIVRVGSLRSLLTSEPMKGNYAGKIDPIIKTAYDQLLGHLITDSGVDTVVNQDVRSKLVELNNALSWKFSTIWLNTIKPVPLPKADYMSPSGYTMENH